jgi:hypothetical protein
MNCLVCPTWWEVGSLGAIHLRIKQEDGSFVNPSSKFGFYE